MTTSSWTPLSSFLVARVTKPFLPMKLINEHENASSSSVSVNTNITTGSSHNPNPLSKHYRNIFPGDLVYLFETIESASGKWARGYLLSQPNPSDFSQATVNMEKLPEHRMSISIVPFSHLQLDRELPITSTDDDYQSVTANAILDDNYIDFTDDLSLDSSSVTKKTKRPAMPVNDIATSTQSLQEEIDLALKSLRSQI
ncbi:unnamed protein product [Ambrosiozyma monospora]|uniref:Unnamed protein product n=1 Tax=Ambrosiozyma monospora TaxID=43982 RepID=A0ACB5TBL6_AMBMO|nr:unnamed protein product [Ambrosiozyma monospora]